MAETKSQNLGTVNQLPTDLIIKRRTSLFGHVARFGKDPAALQALRRQIDITDDSECGSSTGLRRSSSRPQHAGPCDTSSVTSSSASDLRDAGVGVEVSARRSAASLGRPLCTDCVCGWPSSVTVCSPWDPPGALGPIYKIF